MADDWSDLADSELRRRLLQRGCPTEVAIALISRREADGVDALIEEWLGR